MVPHFTTITERPENSATMDQLSMLTTRYHFARRYAAGKELLEVACGSGIGLGYLAKAAKSVVGGDVDEQNCRVAERSYSGRKNITVGILDAERLPFRDAAFDLVILFEALYYLHDAHAFFQEARRVLRPGGVILISSVNCEWDGFNPSPFSTKYLGASELSQILWDHKFQVRMFAAFPEHTSGFIRAGVGLIRRVAVRFKMIPSTMKGKEFLKRLFYGKLTQIPRELPEDLAQVETLVDVSESACTRSYRMLYAVGSLA